MPLRVSRADPHSPPAGRPGIGQHARPKIREGIEQGGNEHITGDAADRIEVDVRHRVTRPDGPARHRGPRG